MKRFVSSALIGLACTASSAFAQHAQVTSVVVNPANPSEVWVCNRGNDSVSVVDTSTGTTTHEIEVGVWPRTLAFSPDGSEVLVTNQRGNVPVDVHFVTPFTGTEIRGTVSVIDVATKSVTSTLTDVGTEPYGIAYAPNGKYFAISGHRSGTIKLYDAGTKGLSHTLQYPRTLNFISSGSVIDVDENLDMLPDLMEPRAFVIRDDSAKIYVTHLIPGYVSAVDVTLNGMGNPLGISLATRIDLNEYAPHPIFNPVNVQTVESQGTPRFLDDIALSPDGTRALVPHLLHNLNHDVNHDFGGAIDGDFANRVYPALTVIDTAADSYAQGGDTSTRLHHELTDPADPAAYIPYGGQGASSGSGVYTLGGAGSPVLGGTANFVHSGHDNTSDLVFLAFGLPSPPISLGPLGTLLNLGNFGAFPMVAAGPNTATFSSPIANNPLWEGSSLFFQCGVFDNTTFALKGLSNGLEMVLSANGVGDGKMGHRAGHPGRVLYSPDGSHALMLNRGSEDVFLYSVSGSTLTLETAFPPRHNFVERAPLDTSTPMGDLPLGMVLVDDASTVNNDSLLHIINETTRTLTTLRIDWDTGAIAREGSQVSTLLGPDQMTLSEIIGQELFDDASRASTAGNFNNSCESCHFEGGADGNVWQRPAGPRSTMPVYGGPLLTGLILWKGVRVNLGETGPMFGGENGGTGAFTPAEVQGLIDYHKIIPVPLNPNLDPVTGAYSATAEFGEDLYFGTNDTGLNPLGRAAGCATCHPDKDESTLEARGYTTDFIIPELTDDPMGLQTLDPLCFSLQENIAAENIRNVNSAVNVDADGDGNPEVDRNVDGYSDLETYIPLNPDDDDDFTRDDNNNYLCPTDGVPGNPKKVFNRAPELFSVPTKLGVFSTGPYFHDHSLASLRAVLDPASQGSDPVFGHPTYPGVLKYFNEFHDIRGHEEFVVGASKVQVTLQTLAAGSTFDADIEALLAYISSL
ncbi:MAG: YncE family protein [Planctomycetota bacterium]